MGHETESNWGKIKRVSPKQVNVILGQEVGKQEKNGER
jgi:hypothetical protein